MAQMKPNRDDLYFFPIKKKVTKVMIPKIAFGNLAANSLIPKAFMEIACSQKKNGGFSAKG
jgi:hypothetical protein